MTSEQQKLFEMEDRYKRIIIKMREERKAREQAAADAHHRAARAAADVKAAQDRAETEIRAARERAARAEQVNGQGQPAPRRESMIDSLIWTLGAFVLILFVAGLLYLAVTGHAKDVWTTLVIIAFWSGFAWLCVKGNNLKPKQK